MLCPAEASEGVAEAQRQHVLPPVNPNAPQLTLEEYFTVPPLRQLQRLPDDKLKVSRLGAETVGSRLHPLKGLCAD